MAIKSKDPQSNVLKITAFLFGAWVGFTLYSLNLQEYFPAVQTFYPNDYRLLAAPCGLLIGTLITPVFLDRYKLRHVLYFGAFIAILGCAVMPFAFAPEVILVDRVFFGVAIGLLMTKFCVFVSAVVPNKRVIIYVSKLVSGFATGCLLSNLFTLAIYDEGVFSRSFRLPYFVAIALVLAWTIWVSLFLPEGPWFYVKQGNDDAAARIMAAFYGVPVNHEDVQSKLTQVKMANKQHALKSPTLITPLSGAYRSKTLISASLLFFTFTSYPVTVLFYGIKLLDTSLDGRSKIAVSIVFSAVFCLVSFFSERIISKFKRKRSMLGSAVILCILSIVLCFLAISDSIVLSVIILGVLSGITSIWLVISLSTVMQIFGEEARSRSIALSLACAWFGVIIVFLFDILLQQYTVFLMAVLSLVSLFWIKLSPLPEQQHLSCYEVARKDLLRHDSSVQ